MEETIVAYSLIKSIYESGKDYLDVFVPFILISFPEKQNELDIEHLSTEMERKIGLQVPIHTLSTIITRAVRRGYLIRNKNKCFLQEKGRKEANEIISKLHNERRQINFLIEDIKDFINHKYSVSLSSEEISETLSSFIKQYQLPLVTFFNPKSVKEEEKKFAFNKKYLYFMEYLKLAKNQKPEAFNQLEKIFYGSIISAVLQRKNIVEINKRFSKLQVFLDTNFIFSIMDLHYPHICKPAKQLFELLKKYEFKLKVFDFTIDEMVRVLGGYGKERYKYFSHIKVDSIYSNLKNKGWTKADCINFVSKIEQKIYDDYGIHIEYTGIDLNKWEIPSKEEYLKISQYKPDQNLLGQKHDICAIEKIKEIRGKPQREIENCIALFLSSDLRLANFNLNELGHKNNFTVCEVISDRLLTTLLWLKNPTIVKELPLEMLLSTQEEILIDRAIWDKFYDNLLKLRENNKISEENISILIYYSDIFEDLGMVKDRDVITEKFILEKIENSKRKMDEDTKRRIEEEIKKMEEKYTEEMAKKDKEWQEKLKEIKSKLKQKAEKEAKKKSNLIWGIPVVLIIISIILTKLEGLTQTIFILISLFSILGIKIDMFKFKEKIYNWYFNKIYNKYLSEIQLEEILK
ncbi:MAG: hypothetical protein ABIM98_08755 [candidate division WOR-3 bacterium]